MSSMSASLKSLIIGVAGDLFAIPVHVVCDILDLLPVTGVPTARAHVNGLINVRGRVVPLMDLGMKIGLPAAVATPDSRFVVIETFVGGEETMVALRADKVHEVAEFDLVLAEEIPRIGMRCRAEFVRAVGRRHGRFVMVLDLERVFAVD
ncbi:MAG: purine-binding chemotaxis protein CheW [Magnetococcales bacterium]|nr:purine-binding chemotaxis protein CheW [Magnetococcales bacterium]